LALGSDSYVHNFLEHGNPIWPVRLDLGSVHLPGLLPMRDLLTSGAAAPHLDGPLPERIVRSWTSMMSLPAFDMRVGGFGPLFLLALPIAGAWSIRRRRIGSLPVLAAALASPDPAIARYVLAVPALVFATAASEWSSIPARSSTWAGVFVAGIALWQLVYALPGLGGEGPPLAAYARLTPAERVAAVGANGSPEPWISVRRRIRLNESFAYDESLDLPYLAWDARMSHRVVWIPRGRSTWEAGELLERSHARVVVAGPESPALEWLRSRPEHFVPVFRCRTASCFVYARR
jgi:hypothetical protein